MAEKPFMGFGISEFRSFFGDIQLVAPLDKINVLAGQNNSGKSNILNHLSFSDDAVSEFIKLGDREETRKSPETPTRP